MLVQI